MTIDELLAATGLTASDEIPIWDAEATGEPTKKITAQQLAAAVVTLANLVTSVNGQTGAVTLDAAGIGAVSTIDVIDVQHGGTGTSAAGTTALSNIGLRRVLVTAEFNNGEYTYDFGSTRAYVIGYNAVSSAHIITMYTSAYAKTYVFTDKTSTTYSGNIRLEIYYILV